MTQSELNILVRVRAGNAQSALNAVGASVDQLKRKTDKARNASNANWFQRISAQGSRIQWIGRQISANLSGPIIAAGRNFVSSAMDQEMAMVRLKKLYGDVNADQAALTRQTNKLSEAFTLLSEKFGVNRDEVTDVGASWAAAGSSGVALAKQTELTLRTMVLGSMKAEEATKALIAIQAQYGQDTEGLTQTINELNAASNVTATLLPDLVRGFSRAAGSAREAGVSTKELAGLIATLTPAAGSANEAGNALKTIFSRLMSPVGEAVQVLHEMGIEIDSEKWKSSSAVNRLFQLAQAYEDLDQAQKPVVGTLVASRWQINRFGVLMRGLTGNLGYYGKAMDTLNDKQKVYAMTQREVNTFLESSPMRIKQAWQSIKNSIIDALAPLLPAMAGIVQWVAKLVKQFQNLSPNVQKFIGLLVVFLGALGPIITALGVLHLMVGQLGPVFVFFARAALLPLLPLRSLGGLLGSTLKHAKEFAAGMRVVPFMLSTASAEAETAFGALGTATAGHLKAASASIKGFATKNAQAVAATAKSAEFQAAAWAKADKFAAASAAKYNSVRLAAQSAYSEASLAMQGSTNYKRNVGDIAFHAKSTAEEAAYQGSLAKVQATYEKRRLWRSKMRTGDWSAHERKIHSAMSAEYSTALIARDRALKNLMKKEGISRAAVKQSQRERTALAMKGMTRRAAIDEAAVGAAAASGRRRISIMLALGAAEANARAKTGALVARASIAAETLSTEAVKSAEAAKFSVMQAYQGSKVALVQSYEATKLGVQQAWQKAGYAAHVAYLASSNEIEGAYRATSTLLNNTWHMAMYSGRTGFYSRMTALQKGYQALSLGLRKAHNASVAATELSFGARMASIQTTITKALTGGMAARMKSLKGIASRGLKVIPALFASIGPAIAGALASPWVLGIAAVALILAAFKDRIADFFKAIVAYFKGLSPSTQKALEPLTNIFSGIGNFISKVFHALPDSIQNALLKVVAIIKAAALKIYELFSYINPFAHHSPSLVENVTNGMQAVGDQFEAAEGRIAGSTQRIYGAMRELGKASAGLVAANEKAQYESDIDKLSQAAPEAIDAYNNLRGEIQGMSGDLDDASRAVDDQQRVVNSYDQSLKAAEAGIEGMRDALDGMKGAADQLSESLDRAKDRQGYFANAQIAGMGAAEDAIWENQMAQKQLELQIKKIGDAAEGSTDKASDAMSKLQGEIEMLSGKKMELHYAGAGSEITDVYDGMIADVQKKQDQLSSSSSGAASGPAAKVDNLNKKLDELKHKGEVLDLEKDLKFGPMNRQLEKMKDDIHELPFGSIVAGYKSSEDSVNSLELSQDLMNESIKRQEAAIKSAQEARDLTSDQQDREKDKLDQLKGVYDDIEGSIRDGEQALSDMTSQADEAIRRAEEAANGGPGGAKGRAARAAKAASASTAGEVHSPGLQNFLDAAGGNFPDRGGDKVIGMEGAFGDQEDLIQGFIDDKMGELGEAWGGLDPFKPIKDAWNKFTDWMGSMVEPIKIVWQGITEAFSVGFGDLAGEDTPLQRITNAFTGLRGALQKVWTFVSTAFGPGFMSILKNLVGGVQEFVAPIIDALRSMFSNFDGFGDLLKIVATAVGVYFLPEILAIVGVFNILGEVIRPVMAFLGDLVASIIGFVQGIIRVLDGLSQIIVGLLTLDGSKIWDGIKNVFGGIWDIISNTWNAIVSLFKNSGRVVWGIVKGFVMGIINFFKGLWDTLVGHSIVPDMIVAIIEWFAKLPVELLKLVGKLTWEIIKFFAKLPVKIFEALVDFGKFLWDAFTYGINDLVSNGPDLIMGILDFFRGLPAKIFDALIKLPEFLTSVFESAIDWLADFLPDPIANVLKFFAAIPGKIVDALKSLGEFITSPFRDGFGSLGDGLSGMFQKAWDFIKSIPGRVIDVLKVLVSKIGEPFSDGLNALADHLPGWIAGPIRFIADIPNKIIQYLSGLKDILSGNFREGFQKIYDLMPGWIKDVIDFVKDLPGRVWEELKDIVQVGKDFIQGLWDGIKSGKDWIVDKVKSIGSSVIDGVKGLFGIHSPSKVMHEVGENIGEGLGNGIGDTASDVKVASDKMVGAVYNVDTPPLPMTEVLDDFKDSVDNAKDALDTLKGGFEDYRDQLFSEKDNQIAMNEAMDDADEALGKFNAQLVDAHGNFDVTTDDGKELHDKLKDLKKAFDDNTAAAFNNAIQNGATYDEAINKADEAAQAVRDSFIEQAEASGIPLEAAKALADQYHLIPEEIKTLLYIENPEQFDKDIQDKLKDRDLNVNLVPRGELGKALLDPSAALQLDLGGSNKKGYKSGGWVSGPGTSTSDSILGVDPATGLPTAWVSDSEFVVNAMMAKKYAGVLEKINAGTYDPSKLTESLPAFASGTNGDNSTQKSESGTDGVSDEVIGEVEKAKAAWSKYVEYMKSSSAELSSAIELEFSGMVKSVSSSVSNLSSDLSSAFTGISDSAQKSVSSWTASYIDTVSTAYKSVTSSTTGFSGSMTSILDDMNKGILNSSTATGDSLVKNFDGTFSAVLDGMGNFSSSMTDAFDGLAQNFSSTFDDGVKPVFDSFKPMLDQTESWFEDSVNHIGSIWDGIKEKTADPARFVIDDVYNDGIRGAWNKFNKFLELPELEEHVAKFATGGSVRGAGTGTSDSIPALLSNNEHVVTANEVRGAGGHRAVEGVRALWASGNAPAFAEGGRVALGAGDRITTPSQQAMWDAIRTAFPNAVLTSATRTYQTEGHPDNHNSGLAIDIAGPMDQMANWIADKYPGSMELIHSPFNRNIKNGRFVGNGIDFYGAGQMAAHANHVHWASSAVVDSDGKIVSLSGGSGGGVDIQEYVKNGIKDSFDSVRDRIPDIGGGIGEWPEAAIDKAEREMQDFLGARAKEYMAKFASMGGGNVEQWRGLAEEALRRHGYNPAQYIEAMLQQIQYESNGDPRAVNLYDSNAANGTPSGGLLQVIEPTYRDVRNMYPEAFEGLPDDRFFPLTNLVAGVGAVRRNWGGPAGRWPTTAGYDDGGVLPPTPGGYGTYYNHTGKTEAVLTNRQWDAIYSSAKNATGEEAVRRGAKKAEQDLYGYNPGARQADRVAAKVSETYKSFSGAIYGTEDNTADLIDAADEGNSTQKSFIDQFVEFGNGLKEFVEVVGSIAESVQQALSVIQEKWDTEEYAPLRDFVSELSRTADGITAADIPGIIDSFGKTWDKLGEVGNAQEEIISMGGQLIGSVLPQIASLIEMIPKQSPSYMPWNSFGDEMTAEQKRQSTLNDISNFGKGALNIFSDLIPKLLTHTATIAPAILNIGMKYGPMIASALAMAPVNPVGALIAAAPAIIEGLVTLVPAIIAAIVDIVPSLLNGLFDLFNMFGPNARYTYETYEEASKAAWENREAIQQGADGPDYNIPEQNIKNDNDTTNIYVYDVSLPNIKNGDDAESFITNLKGL